MTPTHESEIAMSILITLTPQEEQKLAEVARAQGKDSASHARDVVTAYLKGTDRTETRSIEEIFGPIWEGWRQSGMTECEVDDLLEEELHEARSERARSKGSP